jgi:hypothetical protein
MDRAGKSGAVAGAVALASLAACILSGGAAAGVVDRITQDKSIRIAYREDAPPFSSKDWSVQPPHPSLSPSGGGLRGIGEAKPSLTRSWVRGCYPIGNHLAMLDDGEIAAYFGDRSIVVSLSKDSKAPENCCSLNSRAVKYALCRLRPERAASATPSDCRFAVRSDRKRCDRRNRGRHPQRG